MAFTLFQRACENGVPEGCKSLGDSYEFGEGVASDQAKASALYRKACGMGDTSACGKEKGAH